MISNRSVVALVGTLLLALGSTPALHAQAQRWIVPFNVIDFNAAGPSVTNLEPPHVIPLLPPASAANGVFDSNGNLVFYVISTPSFIPSSPFPPARQPSLLLILDAQGDLIDSISLEGFNHKDDSINQMAVFAVPGACDQFIIVYFLSSPSTQNTIVSLRYSVVDVAQKKLVQRDLELPITCLEPIRPRGAIAVSRLRKDQTRFLYAVACGGVDKFVVEPNGLISSDSTLFHTGTTGGVISDDFLAIQAALSSDGKKLAWSNGSERVLVADLDPDSGDNVNTMPTIIHVGSATAGLAFNPGGDLLFLSPTAQQGGPLSHIDFNATTPKVAPIGNSEGYAGSLLQLAADHRIYAAGDSDLGAIVPTSTPPSFIPAAVPGIVAPAPKSVDIARTLPYQINGEAQLTCENLCGNPALIQSSFGTQGNFEVVVPYPGGGMAHYWRANDGTQAWIGPNIFGTDAGAVDAVSLIQSSYGQHLEVVARIGDHLEHFWRDSNFPTQTWYGPSHIAPNVSVSGTPSFIQGRFGTPGNFEVVTPLAVGGMAHFWRDNSPGGTLQWSPPTPLPTVSAVSDVSLIQGNLGSTFDDLEVVARIGDQLFHFYRAGLTWFGEISSFVSGVTGTPSFVQGRFGIPGNFELVTPLASGGMTHLWRDNTSFQWYQSLPPFSGGTVRSVSVIQGNYGNNLEAVARIGCSLIHYWRDSFPPFTWHQGATIIP